MLRLRLQYPSPCPVLMVCFDLALAIVLVRRAGTTVDKAQTEVLESLGMTKDVRALRRLAQGVQRR